MTAKKVLAVIPVRIGSSRLSRKPLAEIAGKSMTQRVWEACSRASQISRVIVATDSEEIYSIAQSFGAECLMTSPEIPSGSARVAAAYELLKEKFEIVVNVQGDMPSIKPELIDQSIIFFKETYEKFQMATIASAIYSEADFLNPNKVKVVLGTNSQALYFSRSPIPYSRDGQRLNEEDGRVVFGYRHMGLYLYKPEMLSVFTEGGSALEEIERLEQLRVLERGFSIGVKVVDPALVEGLIEVDTAEDLEQVRSRSISQKLCPLLRT